MKEPTIIAGGCFSDERGALRYNNTFDAAQVQRVYIIENNSINFVRGWQGHRIEQRWFSAMCGNFTIQLIQVDDWEKPSPQLPVYRFELSADSLDVLHTPAGYVSAIQATTPGSKLLVMADYKMGAVKDEYRFPQDYFLV